MLGHCNSASLIQLERRGFIRISGKKSVKQFMCRLCKDSKASIPHYQRGSRSPKRPGEVVDMDLVGPFTPDINGYTYMVIAIDEATRTKRVYGVKNRRGTFNIFKPLRDDFAVDAININTIQRDGAGELGRSMTFRKLLLSIGIKWESCPPYTHQQHGIAERAIRQITEGGRVQLAGSYLGDKFWFSACKDFAEKSNLLPHQTLGGQTPYEEIHHAT